MNLLRVKLSSALILLFSAAAAAFAQSTSVAIVADFRNAMLNRYTNITITTPLTNASTQLPTMEINTAPNYTINATGGGGFTGQFNGTIGGAVNNATNGNGGVMLDAATGTNMTMNDVVFNAVRMAPVNATITNNNSRMLRVQNGATAVLNNVTVKASAAGGTGSSLFVTQPTGTMTINNSHISGASLADGNSLGGTGTSLLYNQGTMTLNGTDVNYNYVNSGTGNEMLVRNAGTLNILNGSQLSNNSITVVANNGILTNTAGTVTIDGSAVSNNTVSSGTSFVVNNAATMYVQNGSIFSNNTASGAAGRILANAGSLTVDASTFILNSVTSNGVSGGAIYNNGTSLTVKGGSVFANNTAGAAGNATGSSGGAIQNAAAAGAVSISDTTFTANRALGAGSKGGAIYNASPAVMTIDSSTFNSNGLGQTANGAGGAIYNDAGSTINITGTNGASSFTGNAAAGATARGGAIANNGTMTIDNANFKNNSVGTAANGGGLGGAVYNGAAGVLTITDASFTGNKAQSPTTLRAHGGAIATDGEVTITAATKDVNFDGNSAVGQGGAIRAGANGIVNVVADGGNVNFTNNTAGTTGGAIQSVAGTSQINLTAENGDITFTGNTDMNGNVAINVGNALNLTADNGNIIFNDQINGLATSSLNINGATNALASGTGNVEINTDMAAMLGAVTINGGTIKLKQDDYFFTSPVTFNGGAVDRQAVAALGAGSPLNMTNITMAGNAFAKINVDLASRTGSFFSGAAAGGAGQFLISDINLLSNKAGTTLVPVGDAAASPFLNLDPGYVLKGHTYNYDVSYIPTDGAGSDAFLKFAVIAVAATGYIPQTAMQSAYLNQLNAYATVLNYVGMENPCLDGRCSSHGIWFRPYGFKENVDYRDGVKVRSRDLGAYLGYDTRKYDIGRDYQADFTVFAGYNDGSRDYKDVDISQNSGTLGAAAGLYKGSAFAGLTLSGTDGNGKATSSFGKEEFDWNAYGAALKLGYNARLSQKFVLQPSLTGAYTAVTLGDYTSAAGVPVSAKNLTPVTLSPGVKLLAGLSKTTYARAGVSYNYTASGKSKAYDGGNLLPEIYTSNYLEYSVGAEHMFTDNFSAGLDLYARNLDRTGVGAALDLRFLFGKYCKPLPAVPEAQPAEEAVPAPLAQEAAQPAEAERNVLFAFDRYDVSAKDKASVINRIERLKQTGYYEVRIEGHTDNIGTAEYNQKLSVRRANAVYKIFKQQGLTENVTVKGFGKTRPVATNKTKEGRAQNRRVEIVALKKI